MPISNWQQLHTNTCIELHNTFWTLCHLQKVSFPFLLLSHCIKKYLSPYNEQKAMTPDIMQISTNKTEAQYNRIPQRNKSPSHCFCHLFWVLFQMLKTSSHVSSSLLKVNINNFRFWLGSRGVSAALWKGIPFRLPNNVATACASNFLVLVTSKFPLTSWTTTLHNFRCGRQFEKIIRA